jgi:hypothetical protein
MTATTPAYVDLDPHMWRSLLARAAIFHATRTRLLDLSDSVRQPGVIQGVFNDLELSVSECAAEDFDDETTVARVVAAWDAVLTQKLSLKQLDETARHLLAELQVLVRCASGTDPIHDLFTGVSSRASALYGNSWRPPKLMVSHVRSHPRGALISMDPYVVSARTPWPCSDETSAVELLIFCEAFGPAAYAAVPMLLIHECVCHVPARQDHVKNDSPFAEGLLDWASYFFLDIWAGKIDNGLSIAARMHGRALRQLLTQRSDTAEGRARQIGHRAAETLVSWFEDEFQCETYEAMARVSRLAVALNQVERPLINKDYFVSRLCSPIPADLERSLKGWAENTLSAEALLAEPERP